MRFAVYLPPAALKGERVPAVYFLAGLTCTEETFAAKAGAQRVAAELGLALVTCDTSPRTRGTRSRRRGVGLRPGRGLLRRRDARRRGRGTYRMYELRDARAAGGGGAGFPVERPARGHAGTRWGATARWCWRCATPGAWAERVGAGADRGAERRCRGARRPSRRTSASDRERGRPTTRCELVKRRRCSRLRCSSTRGRGRVPGDAAAARAPRGGLRGGRPAGCPCACATATTTATTSSRPSSGAPAAPREGAGRGLADGRVQAASSSGAAARRCARSSV
jgi:hypothetical protein